MRRLITVTAAMIALAAPASAQTRSSSSEARVVSRRPLRAAESAIQTRDGRVAFLLVDRTLVLQMTDRGLAHVARDMDRDLKEESGIGRFIGGIVRSSVRSVLDHGIEYPLAELREARYEGGRLRLVGRDGKEVFQNVKLNDTEVMESFDPAHARAFVARVNQAKRRATL